MPGKIKVIKGDITTQDVDAIVNAANSSLLGGGGVDGAIHRAGGLDILEACKVIRNRQGGCQTGEAVITTGGCLKARFVIHTVGPVWHGGRHHESALLANAYRNSLQLASSNGVKRIAFPNISTGVYGYPKPEAAAIAIQSALAFLKTDEVIQEIIFVCYDDENFSLYKNLSEKTETIHGPIDT